MARAGCTGDWVKAHACLRYIEENGVARASDLARLGVSAGVVRRLREKGDIVPVQRGVYVLPGEEDGVFARVCRSGAHLTCVSALDEWGVPGVDSLRQGNLRAERMSLSGGAPQPRLHTTRCRQPDPAWVVHQGRIREESECPGLVPIRVAAVDMLRCAPALDAHVRTEMLLRQGRVSREELEAALPGARNGRARRRLRRAATGSRSALESLALARLRAGGYWADVVNHDADGTRLTALVNGRAILCVESSGRPLRSASLGAHGSERGDETAHNPPEHVGVVLSPLPDGPVLSVASEDLISRWPETREGLARALGDR